MEFQSIRQTNGLGWLNFMPMLCGILLLSSCGAQQEEGLRVWNWKEYEVPLNTWPRGSSFANDELVIDSEYDPRGVSRMNEMLRFYLDPLAPELPDSAANDFNMRSEIRTKPWRINHPLGTEQWIGWRYIFGPTYKPDPTSPIIIFQNHPGIRGEGPLFELEIAALNRPRPSVGGEIQVVNSSAGHRNVYPVKPQAGDTLDIVIHVVFGYGDMGLLQVWLNDTLYYDERVSTVNEKFPWGGNNKWGIYNHTHRHESDVLSSRAAGIEAVELFMGPLKLLQRDTLSPHYLTNGYHMVSPSMN